MPARGAALWGMPATVRTPAFCTQCRSRCGCIAVVEDGRLEGIEPLPGHPTGDKLCPKGRAAPELVYHPDRLTHPLRRTAPKGAADPGWQRISWDEALDEIASRMAAIKADARARAGRVLGDDAERLAPLRTRLPGSSASSAPTAAPTPSTPPRSATGTRISPRASPTAPISARPTSPTPTACCCGATIPPPPGSRGPPRCRRRVKRGARMIVVDPRPTAFAKRADQWLQVRPGTDQALALGLANLMIDQRPLRSRVRRALDQRAAAGAR